jgi:hypothetical protein
VEIRLGAWIGAATLSLAACGGGEVSSDEEAELAYVGLDQAVSRAMDLGLLAFSLASSANLDPQTGEGDVSGTMTVGGQADQGNSDNKGLRLEVTLVDYADLTDLDPDDDDDDPLEVTYDTETPAAVDLQLKGIPDGTVSGTFVGTFLLVGDLEGDVTLNLALDGELEPDGEGTKRAPASTSITGTATTDDGGEYEVDLVQ